MLSLHVQDVSIELSRVLARAERTKDISMEGQQLLKDGVSQAKYAFV